MSARRVLVTGSSGLIGSALVPRLKSEGYEVLEMDLLRGEDVTDRERVLALGELEVVVHLAGRTAARGPAEKPEDFCREQFLGTLNILELCRRRRAACVYASSYVYGQPAYLPVDENHPLAPANPYALSKAIGESLCRGYSRFYGLPVIVLRLFNVYGRGQSADFLIPTILSQVDSGRIVLGDPDARRDFVHVRDVAEAFVLAVRWPGPGFEVMNIGSGKNHSVREVVELILRLSGRRAQAVYSDSATSDVSQTLAAIGKAHRLLGWVPKIGLEDGLRDMLSPRPKPAA
jgi:nucleoside-diphosphate-sugar epimerase